MNGAIFYFEILFVILLIIVIATLAADKAKGRGKLLQRIVFGSTLVVLLAIYTALQIAQ